MLHSENILFEREDYVRSACEFWYEMEALKHRTGWEARAALSAVHTGLVQHY